ncbi:AfsR-like transcriptional regulator TcrA [Streptomyces thermolineatus]|uniref:AfsR-like transcriptional regulator TcrA n=1 Tax=Streptomyces thermolineatus TaxID=44033 RepID=A0ABP5YMR4_9ACTN
MGGKKKPKGGAGKNRKGTARDKTRVGSRVGAVPVNDFRAGHFSGPAQGSGTQYNTFVQQYAPVPTALASLPPLPPEFTGRDEDLAFLLDVLAPDQDARPAVAVLAGLPGVGKTTLAHAAGHAAQKQNWFTGVLLVGLRGYDPTPARPEEVLDALLRSMGVPAEHIPPTAAEREALYRSQLDARARTGERLLVIADNASSVEQVRPLLPPGRHGLLVTSRRSLPGLGRLRSLNLLQPEDAVALLDAALKNADPEDCRVEDDPEAAERVSLACGCLPLALQITAALLVADPGQPLAERADRLTHSEGRLEGLDDGERSLRAAFDQSLDRLPPQQADLFRLLSLNAGPDISTAAVTALTGQSQQVTEHLLGQLATAHLIQRSAIRGRWQMHDLLRDYAAQQAAAHTAASRPARRRYEQARARLVDHYLRTAEAADTHFRSPAEGIPAPLFEDRNQALEWLDAERANLIATARTEGATSKAARLAFAVGRYLEWRRRLQDSVAIRALALDACRETGDDRNEAGAWNNLGATLQEVRRFDEAITAHETARTLYQQSDDTNNEATTWNNLGNALRELQRFDEAITASETARTLYQQSGDADGEAGAWNNLGLALQEVRRFDEAITAHETACALYQQSGDTHGEAIAWNNLGTAFRGLQRFPEAVAAGKRAIEMLREAEDSFRTGEALGELATTLTAAQVDAVEVRAVWLSAAEAYEQANATQEATDAREQVDKVTENTI